MSVDYEEEFPALSKNDLMDCDDWHITIDSIIEALNYMVTQLVAHRSSDHKRLFLTERPTILRLSHPDLNILDVVEDPMGWAYQAAVRRLGYALYSKLSQYDPDPLGQMESVLHAVARRDPENEGRRGIIMDKSWDGIGDRDQRWMA